MVEYSCGKPRITKSLRWLLVRIPKWVNKVESPDIQNEGKFPRIGKPERGRSNTPKLYTASRDIGSKLAEILGAT